MKIQIVNNNVKKITSKAGKEYDINEIDFVAHLKDRSGKAYTKVGQVAIFGPDLGVQPNQVYDLVSEAYIKDFRIAHAYSLVPSKA